MIREVIICNLTDKPTPKVVAFYHACKSDESCKYKSIVFSDLLKATQNHIVNMTEDLVIETYFDASREYIILFDEENKLLKKFHKHQIENNIKMSFEKL